MRQLYDHESYNFNFRPTYEKCIFIVSLFKIQNCFIPLEKVKKCRFARFYSHNSFTIILTTKGPPNPTPPQKKINVFPFQIPFSLDFKRRWFSSMCETKNLVELWICFSASHYIFREMFHNGSAIFTDLVIYIKSKTTNTNKRMSLQKTTGNS